MTKRPSNDTQESRANMAVALQEMPSAEKIKQNQVLQAASPYELALPETIALGGAFAVAGIIAIFSLIKDDYDSYVHSNCITAGIMLVTTILLAVRSSATYFFSAGKSNTLSPQDPYIIVPLNVTPPAEQSFTSKVGKGGEGSNLRVG